MNVARIWLSMCLLAGPVSVVAQDYPLASPAEYAEPQGTAFRQPASAGGSPFENLACEPGWFVGLGGSFNSVRVDQDLNGVGNSSIYNDSGALVATGTATGPAPPFHDTKTTFAPMAQIGYFRNFEDSDWLWGAKFSYKYLGLTLSNQNFDAPQTGSFTTTSDPPTTTPFTGNAFTLSAQTSVNHELLLLPFVGHSFKNGRIYVGGGPVVFDTQSRLYGLYSYADINGVRTNIGGPPLNLASDNWMWGGAGQVGLSYYLRPSWFVDFSYSFMVTGSKSVNFPLTTTSTSDNKTYVTHIQYELTQRVWAQSFAASLNLKF